MEIRTTSTVGGPTMIVPISDDVQLHIPVPINAHVETDTYTAEITVVPHPESGVPTWSRLKVEAREGVGSNDALRAFGFRGVLEEAVRRAGIRYVRKGRRWHADLLADESSPGAAEVTATFKAPKRGRIPEAEIEKAAEIYRLALAGGRRDPTMAVAEALRMPRATAARRVQLARDPKRGLLGPSVGTKAGEAK